MTTVKSGEALMTRNVQLQRQPRRLEAAVSSAPGELGRR